MSRYGKWQITILKVFKKIENNITFLNIEEVSCFMPTHGSLTKAGKVRGQTPKVEGKVRVSRNPRVKSKRSFKTRIVLNRTVGQKWDKIVRHR
ncbi:MAG: 30S ribosomal protein S30e [Nitrososphaerales archaeon]|nr:30S ribosomal protein S30e [Nitrososphaerales archaeon]